MRSSSSGLVNRYSAVNILSIVLLAALCLLCSLVTVFGFYFYGREIILSMGSNDKSLLFWYLPLLLFGVIALKIAVRAGTAAYRKIKAQGEGNEEAG
jgi:hypothetical protein